MDLYASAYPPLHITITQFDNSDSIFALMLILEIPTQMLRKTKTLSGENEVV